jgi:Leucine-rich repeat (LRR) protein
MLQHSIDCIHAIFHARIVRLGDVQNMSFLQLPNGEKEQMAAKRASMPFREVQELMFSYRDLVRIDNLLGLDKLTKLNLDCNRITKIENLSHLVRFVGTSSASCNLTASSYCATPRMDR